MKRLIGCLLIGSAAITGCRNESASGTPPMVTTTPVSQDIDLLAKLISLPQRPLAVQWTVTTRGDGRLGPQDEELTAVLKYPSDAASSILADCPAMKEGSTLDVEAWFPDDLKRLADGKDQAPAGDWRTPAVFVKSPFLDGTVLSVPDTGTILLRLFTR